MSFITNIRADKLIADIKATEANANPRDLLEKLARLGPSAIPRVIDALANADKRETNGFVAVLTALLDNKSFPTIAAGLLDGNQRTVGSVATALSGSQRYSPNLLLPLLDRPEVPKSTVIGIMAAHKTRMNARDVLLRAYSQEAADKTAMFKIVADIADDSLVPELLSRLEGKDPIARTHIINILARFNRPDVAKALEQQLAERNKYVRLAALNALSGFGTNVDPKMLCEVLRDPDTETQQKAIDAVVKANHPETMQHLLGILRDEDESARRAAVEVLNEIGTPQHIKYLLQSIKDDDWWVRSRAADALAKIGGPRVIEAALGLIRDQDEDVRRAAIEILNQTKDERAVGFLIEATRDNDWWVRERAVDALAEIGSPRAIPTLKSLLDTTDDRSLPTVIRALGKLGDTTVINRLIPFLERPSKEIRLEVITALGRLVDDHSADLVRARLETASTEGTDPTVHHAAIRAMEDLDQRFATGVRIERDTPVERMAEPSRTLLVDRPDFEGLAARQRAETRLDISTLKPGDVLEGRYKYLQKIGKGAFGTVLLMEDTVVDERLILKFLNPNVSQDEEMMKRFVHELRYSRKITHRNVIRIYDFLFIRGNYAISMEYFPSHTLGHEIGDKAMQLGKAVRLAMDIATGMSVAHASGIIHRDLKPANVLIDDTGLVKIVDFGVAAAQAAGDTQLTKTGYVIGSPKYMAPEQILGKKVDERADIYSLGVMLYEMVTGDPPYHRGDHMAVMYQHVQGKAKPPIEINTQLPPGMSDIVMKAMAVDKQKRFQTMDEMRAALEHYL
jgi:serine/threonine-protein kinase